MTGTENETVIMESKDEIMPGQYDSRELVLVKLEVIDFLHHKALEGRVRNLENDKVRIQWFKAMIYACSIYNQIKRDVEIDDLKEDVEEIKKLLSNSRDLY